MEKYQLTYDEAYKIIGGLGEPGKMPWKSWSLDARLCQTGAKLAEVPGSVCNKCYALRGNYNFSNVRDAQARRLTGSADPRFVEAFAFVLNTLYTKGMAKGKPENRFRWFDAGDLQSVEMLTKIAAIAVATPQVRHWLPTKEPGIVSAFRKAGGVIPRNLVVRLSASMVGQTFPRRPQRLPFSTVGRDTDTKLAQCPAASQGNQCLSCDRCWTRANVNYHAH